MTPSDQKQYTHPARWQAHGGPSGPARPAEDASSPHAGNLTPAQRALQEALAAGRVDAICSAYLALRAEAGKAAGAEDLLEAIATPTGHSAGESVVAAFAHRRCYMCSDGTSPCGACEGTGRVEQRYRCHQCEGLGLEPCAFCGGTAWADLHEIPAELLPAADRRRARHIAKAAEKLAHLREKDLASADRVKPQRRHELIGWLIRLQARLGRWAASSDLAEAGGAQRSPPLPQDAASAAARIDRLLKALQVPAPAPRPDDR